jgi:hypothetical protein
MESPLRFPVDWHRAGMDPRWIFDTDNNNNNNRKVNEPLHKRTNRSSGSPEESGCEPSSNR